MPNLLERRETGDGRPEPSLRVIACPHPFKLAHQEFAFAPTISLAQVLREVQPDALLRRRAHIWVNDRYISPGQWESTFPPAGAEIAIRAVPAGGVGRIIGMVFIAIAAIAATIFLGPAIAGFIGFGSGALWGGLAGLAVGVVGTMALNALFPPVLPGSAGTLSALTPGALNNSQSSPTLSITGATNKANLWGRVPFILGRFRVAPFLGASTYTESVGADQYLRLLFVWNFAGVLLEDLRILDTLLENFPGLEVEHRNLTLLLSAQSIAIDVSAKTLTRATSWLIDGLRAGNILSLGGCTFPANDTAYAIIAVSADGLTANFAENDATTSEPGNGSQTASLTFGDEPVTLYPIAIEESLLAVELEQNVENIRTSGPNADELSIDLVCNSLMAVDPQGNSSPLSVEFEVVYRLIGTLNWLAPVDPTMPSQCFVIDTAVNWKWGDPTPAGFTLTETPVTRAFTNEGGLVYNVYLGQSTTLYTGHWEAAAVLTLTGNTKSAVRGGLRWLVPERGQYEVRIKRLTAPDTIWTSSVSFWDALRTIRNEDPLNFPLSLAKTAMRIKATGQLNGTVDTFKGTLTTICPDWDKATQTWISRPTQNPASLFRWVLQGPQNQKPLADSRIDLAALQHWHEYCETEGWKYNKYIDYACTVEDLLKEAAAASRAAYARLDSKVGVIIDEPQDFTIGPAFTPRNILKDSFQGSLAIKDRPHGYRCPFINEQIAFQQDERVVLTDGYQIDGLDAWGNAHPEYPAASVFEQLDLPGVTDPALIFRAARYHDAVARLRCETTEFGTDLEWLVATRGDRIKFAHDVMLAGLSWGRVKSLIPESIAGEEKPYFSFEDSGYFGEQSAGEEFLTGALAGITTDEPLPMEAGKNYVLRFRLNNNVSLLCPIVTAPGSPQVATFLTPIPPYAPGPPPSHYWPAVGDLFLFGEAGLEAVDLMIKSIQPNSDLSATVVALPYDENIYLADAGPIPDHDPKIAIPPEWGVPLIFWVRSDGSVLFPIPGGGWQSRILISLQRPSALDSQITGVEARFRVAGSAEAFLNLPVAALDSGEISLLPVTDGQTYEFQLRYVQKNGTSGPWTELQSHFVQGKTAPPSQPQALAISQVQSLVNLYWEPVPDKDVAGYFLAFGSVGCIRAAAQIISKVTGNNYSSPMLPPGTWDFLLWAADTSGNVSAEARSTFRVMEFYQVLSQALSAPGWPGILINMTLNPGTGHLIPADQDLATGDNFEVFDKFVVNPYASYGYEAPEIDLGADISARAWGRVYDALGPGEAGAVEPEMEFDYREAAGAYGGFAPWTIGPFLGRYAKFKVVFNAAAGNRVLRDFQPMLDKQD